MSPVVVYPLSCSVLQAGFVFGSSDRRCGLLAVRAHATLAVTNPSFEGSTGWTGLTTGSEEFWAAPFHLAGAPATTQTTEIAGRPNQRHVYATYKSVPAELQLLSGSVVVATSGKVVSAPQLKGVAQQDDEKAPNDDGGNGWFDGDYRMQLGQRCFYQANSSNPITDPWLDGL